MLPEVVGKLDGFAMRVPTPNVSVIDLVCEVEKDTTKSEVNAEFKKASHSSMKGILAYSEVPLVSRDFNGNTHSSIVDAALTNVINKRLVKILSWYDNEWGYSCRVVDLCQFVGKKLLQPVGR